MCRTNLPKEVMSYPDFPFDEKLDKFLSADDVMQYLHQYADAFNLRPLIKVILTQVYKSRSNQLNQGSCALGLKNCKYYVL